jgi:hypothetical protein
MTYKGHVEKGLVVLDEPLPVADGTPVRVEVLTDLATEEPGSIPSVTDRMAPFIGQAMNLPDDAAENHDHYLYGTRKR